MRRIAITVLIVFLAIEAIIFCLLFDHYKVEDSKKDQQIQKLKIELALERKDNEDNLFLISILQKQLEKEHHVK